MISFDNQAKRKCVTANGEIYDVEKNTKAAAVPAESRLIVCKGVLIAKLTLLSTLSKSL
jgi:hypothetical protein